MGISKCPLEPRLRHAVQHLNFTNKDTKVQRHSMSWPPSRGALMNVSQFLHPPPPQHHQIHTYCDGHACSQVSTSWGSDLCICFPPWMWVWTTYNLHKRWDVTSVTNLHYKRVPLARGLSLETLFLRNWFLRSKPSCEKPSGKELSVACRDRGQPAGDIRKKSGPSVLTL